MTVRVRRPIATTARRPRRCAPRLVALAACLLASGLPAMAGPQERQTNPKPVRSTTRWGLDLISEGCDKSASFNALVERLRHTNLIVYVQPATDLPGLMVGVTEFMGVNGDFRYLRISIGVRATKKKLIALIGHELQHATEIGKATEVVDQATLEGLYRRIGHQTVDGYDTESARLMGDVVLRELWRWRAEPGAATAAARTTPLRPSRPINAELTRR